MQTANPILLAPKLQIGDYVKLVSPASYPDKKSIKHYIEVLESWGLRVEVGTHALDQWGYMAGSDKDRLIDLNEAFLDPKIRAIVTTRGGAGAYRIADAINFNAVRSDPKPIIGFSDITNLHLSLLKHCQVGGIHGCLVGPTAIATVQKLLMTTDAIAVHSDPSALSASASSFGSTQGRLIGGNLATVAYSVGVRIPDLSGAILFLEDQRAAGLGTVDRQLTQLTSSGALNEIAGIVLGSFEGFKEHEDRGWTIQDVFASHFESLNIPVLGGIYAGHNLTTSTGDHDQTALPLGSKATLDADHGVVTIDPIVY